MAPVLQCPECGTKHPLDAVRDRAAFPCEGCGRVLKVPGELRRPEPAPAKESTPAAPAADRTQALPHVPPISPIPDPRLPPAPAPRTVPWWMRLILWIIAVPIGFYVVFLVARAVGLFSKSQFEDVFLANGWGRFWPLARLLPVVALAIAGIVQGGVVLLGRLLYRPGSGTRGSGDASSPSADTSATDVDGLASQRATVSSSSISSRRGGDARSTGG